MSDLNQHIQTILQAGKERGMKQKDLAVAACIDPITLTRAKSGNIRYTVFENLVRAAGLRIVLVPDNDLAEKVCKGTLFE